MSLLSPPSVPRRGDQPPDDVDRVLRAFFKAQMPDPWPSLEAPAPPRTLPFPAARSAARWPLMRSRLALAASVALLVVGLLFMSGAFRGSADQKAGDLVPNDTTATPKYDLVHDIYHPEHAEDVHLRDSNRPLKLKIDESLIQGPDGTTIKVNVFDWPTPPR
jgi:hypothetical protein